MGKIIELLGKVEFKDNPCEYMDMEFNACKSINLAYKNLLTAEIHDELQEYPAEELLTESLTWVLRKV